MLAIEFGELKDLDFNLDLIGFDSDELANILKEPETEGLTDEDAVPEAPEVPVTVEGDVWVMGKHRLICGDSTAIDTVEKVMPETANMVFTDPPYLMDFSGGIHADGSKSFIRTITRDLYNSVDVVTPENIKVSGNRINHINPEVGLLEFGKDQYGNKKTHLVPKLAMNMFTPYRRPKGPNIKFFFIYHTSHKEAVKSFYNNLKFGVTAQKKYFKGIEDYVNIKASTSKEHFIEFTNENDPLPDIIQKLENLKFDHDNVKYAAFYLSPFDKFTPDPEDREIYIQIKELFLNEGIVTFTEDLVKTELVAGLVIGSIVRYSDVTSLLDINDFVDAVYLAVVKLSN